MGGGWSAPRPGRFTSGKDPVPIVQEAWWAPGPIWTGAENFAPTGIRSPDRLARSESLYRLSYRGPLLKLRLTNLIRGDIIRLCWSVTNKCSSHKHNISTLYVRFYFVLHVSAIRIEHYQVGGKKQVQKD